MITFLPVVDKFPVRCVELQTKQSFDLFVAARAQSPTWWESRKGGWCYGGQPEIVIALSECNLPMHSVLSSYLLIKRIPSAIMGQFALLGPPKKDFGMDNFFYWANIAHHLF